MQNTQTTTLSRATFMFPLALVLFEFSVYIGNDLVQPAMLAITKEFGVSSAWAPSSMSFYLLGGMCGMAIGSIVRSFRAQKSPVGRGDFLCGDLLIDFVDPQYRKLFGTAVFTRFWTFCDCSGGLCSDSGNF